MRFLLSDCARRKGRFYGLFHYIMYFSLLVLGLHSFLSSTEVGFVSADECLGSPYLYIDLHGGDSDDIKDTNQIFKYTRDGCSLGPILSDDFQSKLNEPRGLAISSSGTYLYFANANKDESFIGKTIFTQDACNAYNNLDSFSTYISGESIDGLKHPYGVLEIEEENLLFVTNQDTNNIMWFDLDTGLPRASPDAFYSVENNIQNQSLHGDITRRYKSFSSDYLHISRRNLRKHSHSTKHHHDSHLSQTRHKKGPKEKPDYSTTSTSVGVFHQFDDVDNEDVRGISYDPLRKLIFVAKEKDGVIVFDLEGNIQTVIDNTGSIGVFYSQERSSIFVGSKDDDSIKEYTVPMFSLYQTFTGDDLDHPAGLSVYKGEYIYALSQNTLSIVSINVSTGKMETIVKDLVAQGEALILAKAPCA